MNASQESFVNMSTILETDISNVDPLVLSGIQNFNPAHAAFLASKARIFSNFQTQIMVRTGNEVNKKAVRTDLTTVGLDFSAKMVSYAGSIDDNVLLNEINFNKSELERSSDLDFIMNCSILSEKATAHLTALIPYGITALNIADFDAMRASFNLLKPLPISGRNTKKGATAAIKAEIAIAKTHLVVMDRAIRTVKLSNPQLFKDYFNAREIIDPQTRMLSGKGTIKNAAGVGMRSVKIVCTELGIDRKATLNGTFLLRTVPNGKYTFVFSRPGYKTVTIALVFYHTDTTEINIVMKVEE